MDDFQTLPQLLACQRDDRLPIAHQSGTVKSWRDWRVRVEQWRSVLQVQTGNNWALYCEDSFEFSAALFALWACQKVACVPGSNQPVIVEKLQQRVDGFIGDFSGVDNQLLKAADTIAIDTVDYVQLDQQQLVMEVFTSGSSGEPEAIPKQLYQLAAEINNLHRLWHREIDGSFVVATVSHHHIYGLLFRVLWPLAAAQVFDAGVCDYLEELALRTQDWQRCILIASPTHLSRIPEQSDRSTFNRRCQAIFSSGAPLPLAASVDCAQRLQQSPIEVFGSSETGGIAVRQQRAGADVLWQPVPGVAISLQPQTGCLQIQSPYLPAPFNGPGSGGEWYVTSDKADIIDGQFKLLGRVDRIVKIEGKRVSITEMEARLLQHEFIEAAKLVALQNHRTELGAVVVLTSAGCQCLEQQGKRALNRILQEFLFAQFERAVLPRRWRYPSQLPVNNQGKVPLHSLEAMFDKKVFDKKVFDNNKFKQKKTADQQPVIFPELVSSSEQDGHTILTLSVPENLLYFDGHFSIAPILPGVVQIHWAEHFGRTLLGFSGDFSHLEAIKFQHVISANAEITLSLWLDNDNNKLYFSYQSANGQHSSGRVVKTPINKSFTSNTTAGAEE